MISRSMIAARVAGRADPGVLHRLAQLVVVDELAGGLHRAEQGGVAVAPRRLVFLALAPRLPGPGPARPPRSRGSWCSAARPRRRSSPPWWSAGGPWSTPRQPGTSKTWPRVRKVSRPAGPLLARPSSRRACSRAPPRDRRRPGSAARPGRRSGGRRRRSSRRWCSARLGIIAWWSVTFASSITRAERQHVESGHVLRGLALYSGCDPTSSAIGCISSTMSVVR